MTKKPTIRTGLVVLSVLVLVAVVLVLMFSVPGGGTGSSEKVLRVAKGSSASEVASVLQREQLIQNRLLFQLYLRITGTDRKLKAGTYKIIQGASIPAIVATLTEGRTMQIQVTIPEGSTSRVIAGILEKAGVCSRDDFLAAIRNPALVAHAGISGPSFEGFLFPDTYLFSENSNSELIALVMAQTFFTKLENILSGKKIDPAKLYEDVILASIVEREYGVESEAGLIASVFKNRLKINMALQSCATIVYIITEKKLKPHPQVVYYADLEIPDPYNSYIHRGLPPGPISNPGETALRAVFNSPQSDYLYFRAMENAEGKHKFSKTFEEHTGEVIPVKGF